MTEDIRNVTVNLNVTLDVNIEEYKPRVNEDYSIDEQISDEIVNELFVSTGKWGKILSDAEVTVNIQNVD